MNGRTMEAQLLIEVTIRKVCESGPSYSIIGWGVTRCWFRHPDDPSKRCAVGHLIPDDRYSEELEHESLFEIAMSGAIVAPGVAVDDLISLQTMHDDAVKDAFGRRPVFTASDGTQTTINASGNEIPVAMLPTYEFATQCVLHAKRLGLVPAHFQL